jgi:hypothetical protein
MDPTHLSLDGLTLSEEGLTLNLASEPETAAVLEHCLIGRFWLIVKSRLPISVSECLVHGSQTNGL